ncbi:MAG: histidinol-phosphatase [Rikenellaceae bacterium]|nr:histidinol-phosphatase [Rikenellaceae bacterium]
MKRLTLFFVALSATLSLSAQYYQDAVNKDMLHIRQPRTLQRVEIDLPVVDGYTPYKADLHNHTIFSDGHLTMEARVREAWADGLDVMAVTEHLEYRPHEKNYVKYLKGYVKKGAEAKNYNFVSVNRPASADAINVDLNYPVEVARKAAKMYDLTIIPGIEITRREGEYSHFNALFTTDNLAVFATETIESIRNAKKQGALVMHNHPGWTHKDMKMTKFEKEVYKEGLLDGIEIMNGTEFYPQAIERAKKYNLFMSSNTDVHYPSAERYERYGALRNMTIIYAKDKSLASLREAIEARRTLALSFGTLAGDEELVRKFFAAAVTACKTEVDQKGRAQVILTNHSSVEWLLSREGEKMMILEPKSSIIIRTRSSKSNAITVLNTWCGENQHLVYDFNL